MPTASTDEIDGNVTVNKILVSRGNADFDGSVGVQEIEITGGEGDFAGNLSVPTLKMVGGVLEGTADITVTEALTWTGGRIDGSGVLYVASTATGTLSGGSTKVLDREMHNSGALTWSDGTWMIDADESDPYGGDPYGGDPYGGGSGGGLGDDADIIKFVNEAAGTLMAAWERGDVRAIALTQLNPAETRLIRVRVSTPFTVRVE